MALLKNISLGKAAKWALAPGGSPSSPWLGTVSPTSRQASLTLGSEVGYASKEKTQRWTWGPISVVVGWGCRFSRENSQLLTGWDVDCRWKWHRLCGVSALLGPDGAVCDGVGHTYISNPVRVCSLAVSRFWALGTVAKNSVTAAGQFHLVAAR